MGTSKTIKITCQGAALIDLDKITFFQENLKSLSDNNFQKLKNSIIRYGISFPFYVWKRNGKFNCIDGHQRQRVLLEMRKENYKIPPLPVDWIDAKDEKEAKEKILLATSQYGEMDGESLNNFLMESGLEFPELKNLIALPEIDLDIFSDKYFPPEVAEVPEPQIDKTAELQKKWKTARGQIWKIGKHRLMCGDSTDKQDVAKLMNQKKAVVMAADPPYGVAYDNSARPNPGVAKPRVAKPRVANDDLIDGSMMQAFLESMIKASLDFMKKNAAFYFWHPMLTQGVYAAAAAAAGKLIHRQIIWVKPGMLLGRGDYHWRHELCFYGWQQGHRPPFYGPKNQDTVWNISYDSVRNDWNHANIKPIKVFEKPILNHTHRNEICYDPFVGAGSQLAMAEQLGRVCYGMEIEPKYVAVTLQRLANMGLKSRLLNPPKSKSAMRRKAKNLSSKSEKSSSRQ